MTISRVPFLAAIADSVRQVPAILTDGHTAIWAAILAALSWAVGAPNLALLYLAIAIMLFDVAVGAGTAAVRTVRARLDPTIELPPSDRWSSQKLYGGILAKMLRLLTIPLASFADKLLLIAPWGALPHPTAHSYPISTYVLWAVALAELISAARILAGAGVIPGEIGVLIAYLRAARPRLPSPPPEDRP